MRSGLILLFLIILSNGYGQQPSAPFNTLIKVHAGVSHEQIDHERFVRSINDTGSVKLEFLSWSPTISYTHEFALGQIFSISGNVGFQYMNLYYGHQHYGAPYCYVSINPQLSVFYRKRFEYYIKLRVGGSFYFHNPDVIPEPTRRLLPEKANLFTGVTLGGFNYFINDKFGLNLEISVWSPEFVTFGFSYRWFRGELPVIQTNENKDL